MSRTAIQCRSDLVPFMLLSVWTSLQKISDSLDLPAKEKQERTRMLERLEWLLETYLNTIISSCKDSTSFSELCDPEVYKLIKDAEYSKYSSSLILMLDNFSTAEESPEHDYSSIQNSVLKRIRNISAELKTQTMFYGG